MHPHEDGVRMAGLSVMQKQSVWDYTGRFNRKLADVMNW